MTRSALVILALSTPWLFAQASPAAERQAAAPAIAYESSGIGDDDPLAAMAGDYNLQLVFATQGSGEYLADVKVLIADAKGKTLLEAESPGPMFFVRLPPGSFRISADFHGVALRKAVTIGDRRRQSLYFHWPPDAGEPAR